MITYTHTTKGSVRGPCLHNHRTIKAAATCQAKDQRACAAHGGYSDRRVVAHIPPAGGRPGAIRPLTDDEANELAAIRSRR